MYEKLKLRLEEGREEDHKGFGLALKKVLDLVEKVYKFFDLLNFLAFLKGYKYRNLLERVLKIEYVRFFVVQVTKVNSHI